MKVQRRKRKYLAKLNLRSKLHYIVGLTFQTKMHPSSVILCSKKKRMKALRRMVKVRKLPLALIKLLAIDSLNLLKWLNLDNSDSDPINKTIVKYKTHQEKKEIL